jgi:hypothetical protein
MPELIKSFIVRPSEQLTPKQIDNVGIKSHPLSLQSTRYIGWVQLCEAEKYTELDTQMRAFLDSTEAIRSTKQIPDNLRKPIEFAAYNGYRFTGEDFMKQIDLGKLTGDLSNIDAAGRFPNDSNFLTWPTS